MSKLYPWLNDTWKRTTQGWERHTHGLLMSGPGGVGKRQFAQVYAKTRLCELEEITKKPCGQCRNCTLFDAGTHPDFHVLLSAEDSERTDLSLLTNYAVRHPSKTVIGVDQIRELIATLANAAHSSQYKIALVAPAENMNVNASNALLKLLEEPPQRTMLLLVTEEIFRLPATVRSRCTQLIFDCPDNAATVSWLEQVLDESYKKYLKEIVRFAGGAPLVAKNLAENNSYPQIQEMIQSAADLLSGQGDPLAIAARWKESPGVAESLKQLQQYISQLIRVASTSTTGLQDLSSFGAMNDSGEASRHMNLQQLFDFYDKICQARGFGDSPLDPALLLEDTLISMRQ